MISDGNSSLRSGDFVRVGVEGTSPTSEMKGQVLHRIVLSLQLGGHLCLFGKNLLKTINT